MTVRGPNGSDCSGEVREAKPRAASNAKSPAPGGSPSEPSSAGSDSVVVSASVRQSHDIQNQNEQALAERIAKLQSAIDRGTYVVDRGRLADRLVDEELRRAR